MALNIGTRQWSAGCAVLVLACGGRTSLDSATTGCSPGDTECYSSNPAGSGGAFSNSTGGASTVSSGASSPGNTSVGAGGNTESPRSGLGGEGNSEVPLASSDTGVRYDGKSPLFCSSEGWCGATVDFVSVWGSRADDVWIVTQAESDYFEFPTIKTLLHWDGETWSVTPISNLPDRDLSAIWGTSSRDVWMVGYYGALAHFDGNTWSRIDAPLTLHFTSVWGTSKDDVWAVGEAGTILHYDGSSWAQQSSPTTRNLNAIWGVARDQVWAVGEEETILSFDGKGWSVSSSVTGSELDLRALWGPSKTDVWAVGSAGRTYHFDGNSWAVQNGARTLPASMDVYAMHGSGNSALWAVGANGQVRHWTGERWAVSTRTGSAALRSAWADANGVWVVGDDATVVHWDPQGSWRDLTRATQKQLQAIWGNAADDVWAVGRDVVHWDGSAWKPVKAANADELLCVWGSSATDVWAGGKAGQLIHWNGSDWSAVAAGTTASIAGIWGDTSSDVWAGTDDGALLHFDGSHWSTHSSGFSPITAVWGTSQDNIMAIGERQRLTFDGASWSELPSDSAEEWSALFGARGSEVWVGGGSTWTTHKAGGITPVLDTWDGSSLLERVAPDFLYNPVVAGWAGSDTDVWITLNDSGARVMRLDGQGWWPSGLGCDDKIGKIWGSDTDIWVLGANGAILRFRR